MTEVVFPALGAAFVVLVVLPAAALLAKAGLTLLERDALGGPLHSLNARYLLLAGSSLLPLAWFLSAGLHQFETGQAALACIFDHDAAALCFEPGLFALALGLFALARISPLWRRDRYSATTRKRDPISCRVDRIISAHTALRLLQGRVLVTSAPDFTVGTVGWLKPKVVIGAAFSNQLSDKMLQSALAHEAEHARALDPLRFLVLRCALAVNPFGRWLLEPHVGRWHAAREAHCDREAVVGGASPLSLADAIVRASRPQRTYAVALGASNTSVLRFRIHMLLAFAERSPSRCCRRTPQVVPLALLLLLFTLVLPHQTGTTVLDAVHTGAENVHSLLWP